MPLLPLESASSTGSTKQAESWPSGRPAFIRVGRVGHEEPAGHQVVERPWPPAPTASSVAPYLRSASATVRATRQNRSLGVSTGLPPSSFTRYRFSSTVTALGDS